MATKAPLPRHNCGTILEPHCDSKPCTWHYCRTCWAVMDGKGGEFTDSRGNKAA